MVDGVTQRITFSERRVKMKYKIRDGGFCAREILDKIQTSCEKNAFIEFIGYFGSSGRILQGTSMELRLLSVAKEKGWIRGLLDKGFIEEVKEEDEQPFVLGDLLLCPSDGYYYLLTLVDSVGGVCLIRVHSSTVRWTDPIKTINPNNISLEEMKMIFGYSVPWSSWFSSNLSCGKKIKRTIKVVTY